MPTPISGPPDTLKQHDGLTSQPVSRNPVDSHEPSSSASPPAYSRYVNAPSDALNVRPGMPVNHLYVVERHTKISGAWTVDPSIGIPAALMPKIRGKKRQPDNLHLSSRHRSIEAMLSLISATPTKSFLTAQSRHGGVLVDIVSLSSSVIHISEQILNQHMTGESCQSTVPPHRGVSYRWHRRLPTSGLPRPHHLQIQILSASILRRDQQATHCLRQRQTTQHRIHRGLVRLW